MGFSGLENRQVLCLLKNYIVMRMGGVDEIKPHNYEEVCTSYSHNTSYVEAQER